MKYIIMHGSQWHETFDDFEEADNYYWGMVDEEGDWFDLTLCRVVDSHEATKTPDIRPHPHWNVDTSRYVRDIDTSKVKIKKLDTKEFFNPLHSEWFNRGKY